MARGEGHSMHPPYTTLTVCPKYATLMSSAVVRQAKDISLERKRAKLASEKLLQDEQVLTASSARDVTEIGRLSQDLTFQPTIKSNKPKGVYDGNPPVDDFLVEDRTAVHVPHPVQCNPCADSPRACYADYAASVRSGRSGAMRS